MSVFGEDLVYLNPGLVAKIRTEVGPEDGVELDRRLALLSNSIREEMETTGASTRAIAMMQYVLRMVRARDISYPSVV